MPNVTAKKSTPWAAIITIAAVLAIAGSCDSGGSGGATGGASGSTTDYGYSGAYYTDSNGNEEPEDCDAWASSADNPLSYSDGYELCEGYKAAS
jgi:hypothetical protein